MESSVYSNENNDLKNKNKSLQGHVRKLEHCLNKAIDEVKSRDHILHQNNLLVAKLSKIIDEYKPYPTVPLRNNLMHLVKCYRTLLSSVESQLCGGTLESTANHASSSTSSLFNGHQSSSYRGYPPQDTLDSDIIELDTVMDLGDDLHDSVYIKMENDDDLDINDDHHADGTNESEMSASFLCKICGKVLPSRSLFAQHQRKHARDSRFKCELCPYRAAQYNRIVRHMRRHTGERPYPCDRCSYRATQSSSLARHMRMHTGERPYACDQCDYTASQSNTLVKHRLSHAKNGPRSPSKRKSKPAVTTTTGEDESSSTKPSAELSTSIHESLMTTTNSIAQGGVGAVVDDKPSADTSNQAVSTSATVSSIASSSSSVTPASLSITNTSSTNSTAASLGNSQCFEIDATRSASQSAACSTPYTMGSLDIAGSSSQSTRSATSTPSATLAAISDQTNKLSSSDVDLHFNSASTASLMSDIARAGVVATSLALGSQNSRPTAAYQAQDPGPQHHPAQLQQQQQPTHLAGLDQRSGIPPSHSLIGQPAHLATPPPGHHATPPPGLLAASSPHLMHHALPQPAHLASSSSLAASLGHTNAMPPPQPPPIGMPGHHINLDHLRTQHNMTDHM